VSHTKTLLMGGFCPSATKPLAKDWRGVWGVVEALLRQGGLGGCEKPFGPFRKGQEKNLFSSSFFVILHAHCKIIKSNK
jgi:hypothetical protein